MNGINGAPVFWFTGLSGAGKTTVADRVVRILEGEGWRILVLDGDDVRNRLHRHLGFSEAEIKENNRLIAGLCLRHQKGYDAIFVPIISPYRESRRDARARIGANFFEIYFEADLQMVMERDIKGLYAKAQWGEIDNMIGYSPDLPYEPPKAADLAINTHTLSVGEAADLLLEFARIRMSRNSSTRIESLS